MVRIKTTTSKPVVQNKVDNNRGISKPKHNRTESQAGSGREHLKRKVRERKIVIKPPVTLSAFGVRWSPNPTNSPAQTGFRLVITATFSEKLDQARIGFEQWTRDRFSIAAGTDPGNVQFKTTVFSMDRYDATYEDGDVATDGVFIIKDHPGYTAIFGLDGTTDLHYTFGAYWIMRLDGAEVLNTSAHPLFATAVGTYQRAFVPGGAYTTHYDLALDDWANVGTLIRHWPALPPAYPVPVVTDP